ncbi:hypothetical protein, partial [Salmonella sp. s57610]|uniref:hypothetical protein n=1 Tax=Salmonella sp. s57610 TaxID=3159697 RepID=UPI00397F1A44
MNDKVLAQLDSESEAFSSEDIYISVFSRIKDLEAHTDAENVMRKKEPQNDKMAQNYNSRKLCL